MTDERTPVNYTYSVLPWDERYQERSGHKRGHFDGYPCAICGKDIPTAKALRYGGVITTDGEWTTDPNRPDSQGWFPVGSDCHRRFVKTLRKGSTVKVAASWQIGYERTGTVVRMSRDRQHADVDFGEPVSGLFGGGVSRSGSIEKVWRIPVKDLEEVSDVDR